jgi:2,5-diamino-6-(ribosylamino)-4(3H)-pyrimidinone 5'-phosphate reductase
MKPSALNHQLSASLPFVLINMAMTADGKIATANRRVSSFSSRRDQDHLLQLRATADAVMAGARTVDLNPVNLGPGPAKYRRLRLQRGLTEFNLRVIVSRSGTVHPNAEVFQRTFSPIIILTTRRATAGRLKKLRAVAAEVKICGTKEINFRRALRWLRKKWGIKRLLCEGGGELNDALFRAGLVNELHLTVCPRIFGGRAAPTIADGLGAANLAQATQLEPQCARRHGDEMFLVYRILNRGR